MWNAFNNAAPEQRFAVALLLLNDFARIRRNVKDLNATNHASTSAGQGELGLVVQLAEQLADYFEHPEPVEGILDEFVFDLEPDPEPNDVFGQFTWVVAFEMYKSGGALGPTLMASAAEAVHYQLCQVVEHDKLEATLRAALRELDLKDEVIAEQNGVIQDQVSIVKSVTEQLRSQMQVNNAVVASGSPPTATAMTRRGFGGALATLAATGILSFGTGKYLSDREIDAGTRDADRMVSAIGELAEKDEQIAELLEQLRKLERAVAVLEAAIHEPPTTGDDEEIGG